MISKRSIERRITEGVTSETCVHGSYERRTPRELTNIRDTSRRLRKDSVNRGKEKRCYVSKNMRTTDGNRITRVVNSVPFMIGVEIITCRILWI